MTKTSINEVELLTNIDKNTKSFAKDSSYLGKHVGKIPGTKFHSKMDDGRNLHHSRDKFEDDHYYASDPKTGHVNAAVSMHHNRFVSKEHKIGLAVSSGGGNLHHIYHHLITKHHYIITSNEQSEGGKHIWSKLSKMKGVNVHGYDPQTKKPHHVDLEKDHPEETHISNRNKDKIYDNPKEKYSKKEKEDVDRIQRMHLVAHEKLNENTIGIIKRTIFS